MSDPVNPIPLKPPRTGQSAPRGQVGIAPEPAGTADLALLFRRHADFCHADTPPESNHMMGPAALDAEGAVLFVLRDDGIPLAMGAIKRIGTNHGEIKSMHVLDEARGRGFARLLVGHLLAEAARMGLARLSLETGAQPSFAGARALYTAAGFVETEPFGDYRPDPMSVFMTRML